MIGPIFCENIIKKKNHNFLHSIIISGNTKANISGNSELSSLKNDVMIAKIALITIQYRYYCLIYYRYKVGIKVYGEKFYYLGNHVDKLTKICVFSVCF